MKPNEYQCDECHGIFEKGWSDEEASQEAIDIFGKPKEEFESGMAIVCDDCFQKMKPMFSERT